MVQSVHEKRESPVVTVTDSHKITRDVKRRKIVNKSMSKDYRVVYDKRIILDDFRTVPYGYDFVDGECDNMNGEGGGEGIQNRTFK